MFGFRVIRILLVAATLLLWFSGMGMGDDSPEQRRPIITGRRLQRELEKPVNIVRNRSTLRDIIRRLRELHGIAILVDRRIDPDQTLDVQFVQMTLREGLELLAAQLDAQLVSIGGTLFLGPGDSTDRICTLIAIRTGEIREQVTFRRMAELLEGSVVPWSDLAEPVQIMEDLSQSFRLELLNPEAIPHDLWGRGTMTDVNAVEAISLLLGQFDLTFEWQPGGEAIRIVPAPNKVVIEKSHAPRHLSAQQAIAAIRKTWPHLQPTRRGRAVMVAATAGEHDAIGELLNPQPAGSSEATTTQGPLQNRRFTLTTTRAKVIAVLRTLELQGTTVEYDPQALEQAGIDLRQTVTLELNQATADEFFTAICEPLGLKYEYEGTTVRLAPQ